MYKEIFVLCIDHYKLEQNPHSVIFRLAFLLVSSTYFFSFLSVVTSYKTDLDLFYRNFLMMFKGLLLYLLKHQEKKKRW